MIKVKTHTSLIFTSLLYICGLVLFLEWIYPLQSFDVSIQLNLFIYFTIYCFLISLLQLRVWASVLLKGFAVFFIMTQLFFQETIFSKQFYQSLYEQFSFNIQLMIEKNWLDFTSLFRTFLLLLLIWLMSYLIYYWFFTMKRILVFVILTFTYVAVLDTFTIYDGTFSIMRVFAVSFFSLGLASFLRKFQKETGERFSLKKSLLWIISIFLTVALSSIVGYASPKYSPQWPDPLPFITSLANDQLYTRDGGGRSGYRVDDSRLGGSFTFDHTPLFKVATERKQYWRVETKDVYTGKGWSDSSEEILAPLGNGTVPYWTFTNKVTVEPLHAVIEYGENFDIDKLVYPYGVRQIKTSGQERLHFSYDTEAIAKESKASFAGEIIEIEYLNPMYPIDLLKLDQEGEPEDLHIQYTQLPPNLPDRIKQLAEKITEPFHNRYDQARAIEQYFGKSGFQYKTENIPYPEEGQDYVDQFLFDTQMGYCDNFSTSMVVMLRSIDIPARWVKGFTGGEKTGETFEGKLGKYDVYEVTNANAHSWVEVFFPEVGWVPFEPTQGFIDLMDPYDENEDIAEHELNDEEVENNEPIEINEPEIPTPEEVEEQAAPVQPKDDSKSLLSNKKVIGLLLVFFLCIIMIIYRLRLKLRTFYFMNKLEGKYSDTTFHSAYHHLLRVLADHGLVKREDQTLREYARLVDEHYQTDEMMILTQHYERMLYNNEMNHGKIEDQMKRWKKFMKRLNEK